MSMSSNLIITVTSSSLAIMLIILLSNTGSTINAQEVEDEREFNYVKGSEKGPSRWGDIKEEWAACKNGKMQSPIDISHHNKRVRIVKKANVERNYRAGNASISNRGHDIMVQWSNGDAGSMLINGKEYELRQAHWHTPSEHTVRGRRYDMELHLVHQSSDGNVSVIAVLYKIGIPDSFLSTLTQSIKGLDEQEDAEELIMIDPKDIEIRGNRYYSYMGSLTTPPCTEGVIWAIDQKVRTVSKEQVELLREAVHDSAEKNARPLQPHNHRDVYFVLPTSSRT